MILNKIFTQYDIMQTKKERVFTCHILNQQFQFSHRPRPVCQEHKLLKRINTTEMFSEFKTVTLMHFQMYLLIENYDALLICHSL